jgi:predicted phosphohydrolase
MIQLKNLLNMNPKNKALQQNLISCNNIVINGYKEWISQKRTFKQQTYSLIKKNNKY